MPAVATQTQPQPLLSDALDAAARRLSAGDAALYNSIVQAATVELARVGELYPTHANGLIDKHDAWMLVAFVEQDGVITGLKWQDGELVRGFWHANEATCFTDLQGVRCD